MLTRRAASLHGRVLLRNLMHMGGVFAQRGHSANYYVVYPRNTPENHPLTDACMIHSKQHQGCRIQGPGSHGKHQTKTKNPCTSRGCRVQNSGPRDPWLPGVKTSRLFAQRGHSARCAPIRPMVDGFPNPHMISYLSVHATPPPLAALDSISVPP